MIRRPELRRVRALKLLQERIEGSSIKEITVKYRLHEDTVAREISWAIKNGYMQTLESEILAGLTQKALKVYNTKLEEGNEYVAKHVLDMTIKLGDRYQAAHQGTAELGLKAYIASKKVKGSRIHDTAANTGKIEESVASAVEGIILDAHVPPGSTLPILDVGEDEFLADDEAGSASLLDERVHVDDDGHQ